MSDTLADEDTTKFGLKVIDLAGLPFEIFAVEVNKDDEAILRLINASLTRLITFLY
ncbi:MAG: hypothetical protein LBV77_02440 [Candidatus Adiutrix intracellularis]|jgi:hypothetical protein|nr:hypothetical protein [Candidatus Adiutrix intracellularis]